MQKIAVIGLGRFGMQLARNLGGKGTQVLAIDRSSQLIDDVKDHVDVAVQLDATDEHALRSQEFGKVDICVIAIGENFETALLSTVLAKKMGVPKVICRAQTALHAQIFLQIGADEVIQPEVQAGESLARKLANPHLKDVIVLAENYSLIELEAPKQFCDRSLLDLALRSKYEVNLVAIKRPIPVDETSVSETATDAITTTAAAPEKPPQEETISVPKPNDIIRLGDILVVVGSDEALAKLPKE